MRTTKPTSSIFHGSKEHLKYKLDDLLKRGEIDFYAFIKHNAEDNEKKDHIHMYIVPGKRIDTNRLVDYLMEIDMNNPLPIKPLPFQASKFDDWYLYTTHDSTYLATKGAERKYHYNRNAYVTSNEDYLDELINQINFQKYRTAERVRTLLLQGTPFDVMVASGIIPINQINQYKTFCDSILKVYVDQKNTRNTNRNDDDLPF